MPRKTRILHGDDEYLFVEAPGDADGPALLIFAKPENPRAVAPGRAPTHQSEHGLWVPIARFDGEELLLAPDPPEGLGERLKGLLPRYAGKRRERIAEAKNAAFWLSANGRALHVLHPAQPSGLLLRLWRTEAAARQRAGELDGTASVQSTGDLREFLALRAEEGFAGALLDDEEFVYFCLDEAGQLQFMKISADPDAKEAASHILDEAGRWQPYEGAEELELFTDPDRWDRLLVRTFGQIPFVGYGEQWRCFALVVDGAPATIVDPEGDGRTRIVPLFTDPKSAEEFRTRQKLGRARVEPVADPLAFVREQSGRGGIVRLQPGDHRVRGGTLWVAGDELLIDGFSGIWHARDGRTFVPAE